MRGKSVQEQILTKEKKRTVGEWALKRNSRKGETIVIPSLKLVILPDGQVVNIQNLTAEQMEKYHIQL